MLLKLHSKAIDIYNLRGGEDNNVKKIKISQKLIAISIISTLFLIVVGMVGLSNMKKLNNNTDVIYNENLMIVDPLFITHIIPIEVNVFIIYMDLLKVIN